MMSMEDINHVVSELRKLDRKPSWVIWGFSLVSAMLEQEEDHLPKFEKDKLWLNLSERFSLSKTDPISWDPLGSWGLSTFFPKWTWSGTFTALTPHPALLSTEALSHELTKKMPGRKKGPCKVGKREQAFHSTVENILKFSPNLFIFIPPTTPIQQKSVGECLIPDIQRMIKTQANRRVLVSIESLEDYDLDYSDFFYPDAQRRQRPDPNHANYGGAKKITLKLADKIASFETREHKK
jgi:hypothetical protein